LLSTFFISFLFLFPFLHKEKTTCSRSLRGRRGAASTASERRAVGSRGNLLVAASSAAEGRAVAAVPAAVAAAVAAAVTAKPAVAARRAVAAVAAVSAAVVPLSLPLEGPGRLLERGRDDLGGQVEDAAEVLDPEKFFFRFFLCVRKRKKESVVSEREGSEKKRGKSFSLFPFLSSLSLGSLD